MEWDFFISHAWEDKEEVAKPLAEALKDKGYKVWYDEFTLKLGDSLRRSIDKGLANSKFGIVILSSSFFAKEWPQKELDGLMARESDSKKIILPVWHQITRNEVIRFSPMLADKMAISTEKEIEIIVSEIVNAVETEVANKDLIAVEETRNLSLEKKLSIYFSRELLSKDEEVTRSMSWVRLKNRGNFEYGIVLKFEFQNSSREPLNESLDVIIETPV